MKTALGATVEEKHILWAYNGMKLCKEHDIDMHELRVGSDEHGTITIMQEEAPHAEFQTLTILRWSGVVRASALVTSFGCQHLYHYLFLSSDAQLFMIHAIRAWHPLTISKYHIV